MQVCSILETCLYVDDLDSAEEFYTRVLGLEVFKKVAGRHVFFRCGDQMFLLFNPDQTQQEENGFPTHGARGEGHVAFAISADTYEAWKQRLQEEDVEIEYEAIWPSGGKSMFFRDPAGNSAELATKQTWLLEET